jgi:subtilisin-like proprotein convertase family protein
VTEQGSGTPVSGIKLGGWVSGADTAIAPAAFRVTTNGAGNYTVPDSLVVGRYDLYASKFGYIDLMETPMVVYGPNTYNFAITAAPSGTISGTVTESGTGAGLYAAVKAYRTDDNSLFATVYTDTLAGGAYSVPGLPYFNYSFVVTSYHHKKITRLVTVSGASGTEDFVMEPTQGDILVINDNETKAGATSKVVGYDKTGSPIVVRNTTKAGAAGTAGAGKAGESATQLGAMLGELGYSVTAEAASATNAATWSGYDLVVWSDGLDTSPLATAAYRTNLRGYVNGGGKLLIEGGELGYTYYSSDTAFMHQVLHAGTWNSDNAGGLNLKQAGHALATVPNPLPASLSVAYSGYGDEDAIQAANGGVVVYGTANYGNDAGIMAYDNDGDPANGQVVCYAFNFRAVADSVTRAQLLENTAEYLLRPSAGPTGSMSGVAAVHGGTNEGVVVKAVLGGTTRYDTTDAGGNYVIEGIYNGSYSVTATKAGYTADSRLVVVSGATVANFDLYQPDVDTLQNNTPVSIPDATPAGIWSYITVPGPKAGVDSTISAVRVYVSITHTYRGDLRVTVRGPNGAADSVVLHDRTGGSADNINWWYPDTVPAQSLAHFAGEAYPGQWGLHVSDLAGGDVGTLNGWKLEITHPLGVAGPQAAPGPVPTAYSLNQAWPNPFHDQTQIRFGLPGNATASLAVYNIAGQRVATLIDGPLAAGYHTVTWNGRTANGQRVSGGMYFYRLVTPDHQETRRLVYIR